MANNNEMMYKVNDVAGKLFGVSAAVETGMVGAIVFLGKTISANVLKVTSAVTAVSGLVTLGTNIAIAQDIDNIVYVDDDILDDDDEDDEEVLGASVDLTQGAAAMRANVVVDGNATEVKQEEKKEDKKDESK